MNTEITVTTILIVILLVGAYFISKEACNQKARSFSEHEFGIFQGCMVKHNNRWIPLENIRGFDDKG